MKSVNDLDGEKIFGPSGSAAISGCDEEIEEIFGSYKESADDNSYVFF